uniref:Uncharacterized protein n=1 Tax=Cyprinus carpio TaxID=7962 RepID=A0A8C2JRK1_CYPCA
IGKTSVLLFVLVNVIALLVCTCEAYQSIKERNIDDGLIININSMSGHRVINNADAHFYSAKLREAKTHIRATCISPGLVETEFAYRLFSKNPEKAAAAYKSIKCLQGVDITNVVCVVCPECSSSSCLSKCRPSLEKTILCC